MMEIFQCLSLNNSSKQLTHSCTLHSTFTATPPRNKIPPENPFIKSLRAQLRRFIRNFPAPKPTRTLTHSSFVQPSLPSLLPFSRVSRIIYRIFIHLHDKTLHTHTHTDCSSRFSRVARREQIGARAKPERNVYAAEQRVINLLSSREAARKDRCWVRARALMFVLFTRYSTHSVGVRVCVLRGGCAAADAASGRF